LKDVKVIPALTVITV
jgi:hypothetical protein